jgi:hypothetical protein
MNFRQTGIRKKNVFLPVRLFEPTHPKVNVPDQRLKTKSTDKRWLKIKSLSIQAVVSTKLPKNHPIESSIVTKDTKLGYLPAKPSDSTVCRSK